MDFGFLTDKEIREHNAELFEAEGYKDELAEGASYDLRLGNEVYISGENYPRILSEDEPFVSIPRGQFALLITREYVKVPPWCLGLISVKFGIKAKGLINVSGFHVDPGFDGKIVFSVFNAGPADVVLRYEDRTFMIFFYRLKDVVEKPYGREKKGQRHLPVDIVSSLKGTSASLSDVDRRVSQLETTGKVYWALLIALIGALLALFLTGRIGG